MSTTHNSRDIHASAELIYQALTEPKALEIWFAPGDMRGQIHDFELRVGGSYTMSLYYPGSEMENHGKTAENEDKYTACFVEITPSKIVQAIVFDSADASFSGEMIMEITLHPISDGTRVDFLFNNIPPGISPEDNREGTEMTLEKLARFVE